MNPAVAALAVATLAGAVLAVAARDVRSVVLGLLVVLAGAPLIADPWPGPLPAIVRVAAALLAVRLIVVGVRALGPTAGSRIGWPAAAILGAAGAVAGYASHGLGAAPLGPVLAQAAGFGLIVLAVAPLVVGRDVLRLGVGAVLLVTGAQLVRVALDRPPSDAEHLVAAFLAIGLGGAVAVIATAATAAGGLEAAPLAGPGRGRRPPDAHRPSEAELRRTRGSAGTGRARVGDAVAPEPAARDSGASASPAAAPGQTPRRPASAPPGRPSTRRSGATRPRDPQP